MLMSPEKIDLSNVTERQNEIFSGDPQSRLSVMKKLNEVITVVNFLPELFNSMVKDAEGRATMEAEQAFKNLNLGLKK